MSCCCALTNHLYITFDLRRSNLTYANTDQDEITLCVLHEMYYNEVETSEHLQSLPALPMVTVSTFLLCTSPKPVRTTDPSIRAAFGPFTIENIHDTCTKIFSDEKNILLLFGPSCITCYDAHGKSDKIRAHDVHCISQSTRPTFDALRKVMRTTATLNFLVLFTNGTIQIITVQRMSSSLNKKSTTYSISDKMVAEKLPIGTIHLLQDPTGRSELTHQLFILNSQTLQKTNVYCKVTNHSNSSKTIYKEVEIMKVDSISIPPNITMDEQTEIRLNHINHAFSHITNDHQTRFVFCSKNVDNGDSKFVVMRKSHRITQSQDLKNQNLKLNHHKLYTFEFTFISITFGKIHLIFFCYKKSTEIYRYDKTQHEIQSQSISNFDTLNRTLSIAQLHLRSSNKCLIVQITKTSCALIEILNHDFETRILDQWKSEDFFDFASTSIHGDIIICSKSSVYFIRVENLKLKFSSSLKLTSQCTNACVDTFGDSTVAAVSQWADQSVTIYNLPQFQILFTVNYNQGINSLLFHCWKFDKNEFDFHLFVGLEDGTVSDVELKFCNKNWSMVGRMDVMVGYSPVDVVKLLSIVKGDDQSIIYCNSSRNAIFVNRKSKIMFERVFVGVNSDKSATMSCLTSLGNCDVLYTLSSDDDHRELKYGVIDTDVDQLRWLTKVLDYDDDAVETVGVVYCSAGIYVVAANVSSKTSTLVTQGVLFVVLLDSHSENALSVVQKLNLSSIHKHSKIETAIRCVRILTGSDGKEYILCSCTFSNILKTLELFSIDKHGSKYTINHVKSISIGQTMTEEYKIINKDHFIVLFNNIMFLLKISDFKNLNVAAVDRIDLCDYELCLEKLSPGKLQEYLDRSSAHYRSLFFNITHIHKVISNPKRVLLLCGGFSYGIKIIELLFDDAGNFQLYNELVDYKDAEKIISCVHMIDDVNLIVGYCDGAVVRYRLEAHQDSNTEEFKITREFEVQNNFDSVWCNKLQECDGLDYIIDRMNYEDLPYSLQEACFNNYLLMSNNETSKNSTLRIKRPCLKLSEVKKDVVPNNGVAVYLNDGGECDEEKSVICFTSEARVYNLTE
ncbi:hypothetical protein AKO1_007653 [Acrasis kona]|uniref:Uncharacterized protein n=1 Tax=Acrasis kona TaxID=1008807 RepID=A0AAW2YQ73_9EUKA